MNQKVMTRDEELDADRKFHGERCEARRKANCPWPATETTPGGSLSSRDGETTRREQ